MSDDELIGKGIRDYCHTRIHSKGRKPNITGQAGSSQERRSTIWNPPKKDKPDADKLKIMICKALEVGVKKVMEPHVVYKFNTFRHILLHTSINVNSPLDYKCIKIWVS